MSVVMVVGLVMMLGSVLLMIVMSEEPADHSQWLQGFLPDRSIVQLEFGVYGIKGSSITIRSSWPRRGYHLVVCPGEITCSVEMLPTAVRQALKEA